MKFVSSFLLVVLLAVAVAFFQGPAFFGSVEPSSSLTADVALEALDFSGRSLFGGKRDHCDIVEKARDWWYAMANEKWDRLAGYYHRTAIRYENGVLSPQTGGIPISPEQFLCLRRRVDVRLVLRHVGSDWDHRFIGVMYDLYINDEPALPIYASLAYDRATCTISVERYYFPTAHPGYRTLQALTGEDCFGIGTQDDTPSNDIDVVKRCYDYFARGDAKRFAACWTPAVQWSVNGQPVPPEVKTATFWARVFRDVKFSPSILTIYKRGRENVVGVTVNLTYSSRRVKNPPSYSVVLGQLFRMDDSGKIIVIDETFNSKLTEPLAQIQGVVPVSVDPIAEALNWTVREAANNYIDTRAVLGPAKNVQARPGGYAYWFGKTLYSKFCVDRVILYDAPIVHVPRFNSSDQARHIDYIASVVRVNINSAKAREIRQISPSIVYEAASKSLQVREYNLGANFVGLLAALRVANGEWSLEKAKNNYGPAVQAVTKFDANGNVVFNRDGTVDYNSAVLKDVRTKYCTLAHKLHA